MSNFKDKIRKELINPAIKYSGVALLEATVISSDRGKYELELTDENGSKKKIQGVSARIYSNDIPEAFTKGTLVAVQYDADNKKYEIVGKKMTDYESYKKDYELKNDIYSTTSCDYMVGHIY